MVLSLGRPALAAAPDSTSADTTKTPRGALLRSALLPGWGQHYNDRPIKMLFFGTASAVALRSVVVEHRRINTAPTPEIHQDRAARRNTRLLYFALCASFAAIDAYVDAHLADFGSDVQLQMRPGGALLRFNATLAWR
ncbi:MAG TPA: hypothetical protein EYG11_15330 [Candidatus Latescibacteria bacterium]|nr:hypothetical protein [Candidatus Latescibacterota bacterium]